MRMGLPSSVVQTLLFTIFTLSTISYQSFSIIHIICFLFLIVLMILRGVFSYIYLKNDIKSSKSRNLAYTAVLLSSVFWVLNLLIWSQVNHQHYTDVIIYVVIAGLTSAAVSSLSANKSVALAYVLAQTILMILGSLYLDFHEHKESIITINLCFFAYTGFIILQIISSHKDLVSRFELNERLSADNYRLQNIMNAIPGYVSYLDKDLKYITVNSKLQDLYPNHVFSGKRLGDLSQSSELVSLIEDFRNTNTDEVTKEIDLTINGNKRAHLLFLKRMQSPLSYVVISVDAQESKDAQEQIRLQKEKMIQQARLVELGEMAAGVAHEINNPLMIMTGRVHNMFSKIQNSKLEPEKLKTSLESIKNASERIAKIVRGLKSFSRSSDEDPFITESLNKIIEDTVAFIQHSAEKENIKIELHLTNENSFINCRPGQISQVIVNLVNNAIDAITEVNSVKRQIVITTNIENEFIKLKIKDSGPGIPKEIQDKIMQPFFTTKAVGKGTGLGLSITHGIVADHKGQISLDSSDKGTVFMILFPGAERLTVAS